MAKKGTDWLKQRGIKDKRVLAAIAKVDRADFAGEIADTLPEPEVVARMLEALHIEEDANVLQVGTGSGYTAALLSQLATSVYSVERDGDVANDAAARLAKLGYKNVQVLSGKTLRQYAAMAPYDGILVAASMAKLPQRLAKRLAVQGALVAPVGKRGEQKLVRLTRLTESNFQEETLGELKVTPLLGDILVEMGVVDRHDVEMAALEADVKGKRLGEALLEGHYVEEADIYKALSHQTGARLVNAETVMRHMDRDLIHSFPRSFLLHHRLIPLKKEGNLLHAATSDAGVKPDDLAQALGLQGVSISLVTPSDFQIVWATLERPAAPVRGAELGSGSSVILDESSHFDAETIGRFQKIIVAAIEARASDIHFERHEEEVRVRLRVDGELQEARGPAEDLTPDQLAGIVQLVKVSARMDPSEGRRPQTGHFQRRVEGKVYDVRARTQPSMFGETVVLRLLPQEAEVLTIEELGFTPEVASDFRKALSRPSGLLLVVGPSGGGKSTTLYAALEVIAEDTRRKVMSVEHPVTYALPNVHQVKISPAHDFGVPEALAAAMGDDVDVILVGDIADSETARQAIEASQAGHLVLGTVHGRDVVDGITKLHDLGVPPNTVATELAAIAAQRLVKRICEDCRVSIDLDDIEMELPPEMPGDFPAFRGEGCEVCEDRGTLGRIAVSEFLNIDASVRELIASQATVAQLRSGTLEAGMKTMFGTALSFASDGMIPLEEVQWISSWK